MNTFDLSDSDSKLYPLSPKWAPTKPERTMDYLWILLVPAIVLLTALTCFIYAAFSESFHAAWRRVWPWASKDDSEEKTHTVDLEYGVEPPPYHQLTHSGSGTSTPTYLTPLYPTPAVCETPPGSGRRSQGPISTPSTSPTATSPFSGMTPRFTDSHTLTVPIDPHGRCHQLMYADEEDRFLPPPAYSPRKVWVHGMPQRRDREAERRGREVPVPF